MRITIIISILLLLQSFELTSQTTIPPEAEEGIYSMNYAGFSFEYTAYIYRDSVYIPLLDVLSFLGIFNKTESEGVIKGYVANEDTSFEINFKENYVRNINGIKKTITDSMYFRSELDYFIQPNILEKTFLLNTAVYQNKLLVYVKSMYELPLLKEMKRQKKYTLMTPKEDYETANLPLISGNGFKVIDGGLLEYRLGANQSRENRSYNYMANVGLQLLGGELQYNAFGSYDERTKAGMSDYNIRWRYFLGQNDFLNQISIGNITNTSIRQVSVLNTMSQNKILQGIQVSNETTRMPTSFSNFIISDKIEPDWQIELYVNNQLYSQTRSYNIGYYKFELPVKYGNTNVELKFYGPNGEFYQKTDFISIPSEYLAPGRFYYTLSGGRETLTGDYLFNGKLSTGITSWLTGSVDYSKVYKQKSYDIIGSASVRITGSLLLSGVVSPDKFYKTGLRINSQSLGSYDIIYCVNKSVDSARGQEFNTLELNGGFPRILGLPVNLTLRAINSDYKELNTTNINAYMNFNLYSIMLTGRYYAYINLDKNSKLTEINHNLNPQFDISWYNKPKFLSFLGNTRFTVGSYYDLNEGKFLNLDISVSQEIAKGANLRGNLRRDLVSKNTSVNLSMMLNITSIIGNGGWSSDLKGNNNFSEDISGILGFDSQKFNFYFSNPSGKTFMGSGAATVRFFVDKNNDRIYQDGEEEVKGVDFYVPNGTIEQGSDVSGGKRIYNLLPGGKYNVFVKKESFKNPFIVPDITEFSFVAEPNAYKSIDVPCYMTGIVEGIILKVEGIDTSGQGGVKVHIVNKKDGDEVTVPVFSDGSFYKSGMMPGNYTIYVDSLQLKLLDCEAKPAAIDFEVRSLADGDYVSGLGFALYPKTISKEKSIAGTSAKPEISDNEKNQATKISRDKEIQKNKKDEIKHEQAEPTKSVAGKPEPIKKSIRMETQKIFYYKNTRDFALGTVLISYLDSLSQYLKNNPKSKVEVTGRTDNFSTQEVTLELSKQRCKAAEDYLISTGIDKNRIIIKSVGSTSPIGDNLTPEGREKNRSLEIKLIE
ncbi:MAG: OmpA family protein [Ignavibacteriae bacterium]|nr:OmpA family protein [Ignavibacteriota bacterium]